MKRHYAKGSEILNWYNFSSIIIGATAFAIYFYDSSTIILPKRWPITDAIVIKSGVTSLTNLVEGDFGTDVVRKNAANFAFTYTVAGRQYLSTRFYAAGQPSAFL